MTPPSRLVLALSFPLALAACQPPAPPSESALAPPIAPPAPKTKAFTLVERAATDTVTDVGAKGDSIGDILTWANDVYDDKNEKKVGTDQGYCLRVAPGKSWECAWSIALADGQIMVEGPFFDAGDSIVTVAGGTGAYKGVGGEMKLHARDPKQTEYDFAFELVW